MFWHWVCNRTKTRFYDCPCFILSYKNDLMSEPHLCVENPMMYVDVPHKTKLEWKPNWWQQVETRQKKEIQNVSIHFASENIAEMDCDKVIFGSCCVKPILVLNSRNMNNIETDQIDAENVHYVANVGDALMSNFNHWFSSIAEFVFNCDTLSTIQIPNLNISTKLGKKIFIFSDSCVVNFSHQESSHCNQTISVLFDQGDPKNNQQVKPLISNRCFIIVLPQKPH